MRVLLLGLALAACSPPRPAHCPRPVWHKLTI